MTRGRPPRLFDAAVALLGVGVFQVADVVLILRPNPGLDPCSLDVFGLRFPGNGDGCYLPVGIPVVLAFATLVFAGLLYWGQPILARITALATGILAVVIGGAIPAQDDLVTTTAVQVGLLLATTFLVYVPTGPRAGVTARPAWQITLVACVVLFVVDTGFSGFTRSPLSLQGSFAVAGALILMAGRWAGRLAAAEPAALEGPAPSDASAA